MNPEVAQINDDAPDVALVQALDAQSTGPQDLVQRECGNCTWCPAGTTTMCNWRFGMYPGDKEPRRSKVVLHALDPDVVGMPIVVAQPYKERLEVPQHTLRWLTLMSLKVPVAVLDAPLRSGGKVCMILTPDEKVRAFVALVLRSMMPDPPAPAYGAEGAAAAEPSSPTTRGSEATKPRVLRLVGLDGEELTNG